MTTAAERELGYYQTVGRDPEQLATHYYPSALERLVAAEAELAQVRAVVGAVEKLCDKREKAGRAHLLILAVRAALRQGTPE